MNFIECLKLAASLSEPLVCRCMLLAVLVFVGCTPNLQTGLAVPLSTSWQAGRADGCTAQHVCGPAAQDLDGCDKETLAAGVSVGRCGGWQVLAG